MFQRMRLATKLGLGFGGMVVLATGLGGIGWASLQNVARKAVVADDANRLAGDTLRGRILVQDYMLGGGDGPREAAGELTTQMEAQAAALGHKLDSADGARLTDDLTGRMRAWRAAFDEYARLEGEKTKADDQMVQAARKAHAAIEAMASSLREQLLALGGQDIDPAVLQRGLALSEDAHQLNASILEARRQEKNYIIRGGKEYLDKVRTATSGMLKLAQDMRARFADDANRQEVDKLLDAVNGYQKAFDTFVAQVASQAVQKVAMLAAATTLEDQSTALRSREQQELAAVSGVATRLLLVLVAVALVFGAVLSIMLTRAIARPLRHAIVGLTSGADQVNNAAGQLSASSQAFATGASEQAAALEETASVLEELAGMTRANADHAREANELATQARGQAESGDGTMTRLNTAMVAINESASEIGKIAKVIEEIAFQTNLLALNAAVEAARAGEHGRGFAVVAAEVRDLARRSADAVRSTTTLIGTAVDRAREGSDVATQAAGGLRGIVTGVSRVAELLTGIAGASEEQAHGVEQINRSISQLDQVTQRSASGAEQSAAASEQLSAQAATVLGLVSGIVTLVEGQREQGIASQGA